MKEGGEGKRERRKNKNSNLITSIISTNLLQGYRDPKDRIEGVECRLLLNDKGRDAR